MEWALLIGLGAWLLNKAELFGGEAADAPAGTQPWVQQPGAQYGTPANIPANTQTIYAPPPSIGQPATTVPTGLESWVPPSYYGQHAVPTPPVPTEPPAWAVAANAPAWWWNPQQQTPTAYNASDLVGYETAAYYAAMVPDSRMLPAIVGVVVNAAGNRVPGFYVQLVDEIGRVLHNSQTGGDGGFRITNIEAGGRRYTLRPMAAGNYGGHTQPAANVGPRSVTVTKALTVADLIGL